MKRRAFTLFELAVAIKVTALVLAMLGGIIHVLYRADAQWQNQLETHRAMGRLSSQFRRDAWAARGAQLVGHDTESPGLELNIDDSERIDFEWDGRRIIRTVSNLGTIQRRETFPMPTGVLVHWELTDRDRSTWIKLRVEDAETPDANPVHQLTAPVGIDNRYKHRPQI